MSLWVQSITVAEQHHSAFPSLPSQLQCADAFHFNADFFRRAWSQAQLLVLPLNDAVIKLAVDHAEPAVPGCDTHPSSQLMTVGTPPRDPIPPQVQQGGDSEHL